MLWHVAWPSIHNSLTVHCIMLYRVVSAHTSSIAGIMKGDCILTWIFKSWIFFRVPRIKMIVSGHQRTGPKKLFRWRNPKRFFFSKKGFPKPHSRSGFSADQSEVTWIDKNSPKSSLFDPEQSIFGGTGFFLQLPMAAKIRNKVWVHACFSLRFCFGHPPSLSFFLSPSLFLSLSLSHSLSHPSLIPPR